MRSTEGIIYDVLCMYVTRDTKNAVNPAAFSSRFIPKIGAPFSFSLSLVVLTHHKKTQGEDPLPSRLGCFTGLIDTTHDARFGEASDLHPGPSLSPRVFEQEADAKGRERERERGERQQTHEARAKVPHRGAHGDGHGRGLDAGQRVVLHVGRQHHPPLGRRRRPSWQGERGILCATRPVCTGLASIVSATEKTLGALMRQGAFVSILSLQIIITTIHAKEVRERGAVMTGTSSQCRQAVSPSGALYI